MLDAPAGKSQTFLRTLRLLTWPHTLANIEPRGLTFSAIVSGPATRMPKACAVANESMNREHSIAPPRVIWRGFRALSGFRRRSFSGERRDALRQVDAPPLCVLHAEPDRVGPLPSASCVTESRHPLCRTHILGSRDRFGREVGARLSATSQETARLRCTAGSGSSLGHCSPNRADSVELAPGLVGFGRMATFGSMSADVVAISADIGVISAKSGSESRLNFRELDQIRLELGPSARFRQTHGGGVVVSSFFPQSPGISQP